MPLSLNPELKMKAQMFASKHLPFLKIHPPQVDRQAALTLRPGRNSLLTWEKQAEGKTMLTVPMSQKSGRFTRLLASWLRAPSERHVELDEVGGFVWELCDGSHTVDAIVQKTGREYKMNRREAEVSVTMFLQMLHEKNYIGFYKKVKKT
jgi:hypothetical protein